MTRTQIKTRKVEVEGEEQVPQCLEISAEDIPVSSNQRCLPKISSERSLEEEVSISSAEVAVSEALVSSGRWLPAIGPD